MQTSTTNLTEAQVNINLSFSGLHGEEAVRWTVKTVENAFYDDPDQSTTTFDLARALWNGREVLRSEGRDIEAMQVTIEMDALLDSGVLSVNDFMDVYLEMFGRLP